VPGGAIYILIGQVEPNDEGTHAVNPVSQVGRTPLIGGTVSSNVHSIASVPK